MTTRIALVVPSIEDCGGVISVAEFVLRTIRGRPDLDLRLISLAMSSTDSCSGRLLDPSSWFSGLRVREGRFAPEPLRLGLAEGIVALELNPVLRGRIPAGVREELARLEREIRSGERTVPRGAF